jgi:hypothetical protein
VRSGRRSRGRILERLAVEDLDHASAVLHEALSLEARGLCSSAVGAP